VQRQEYARRVEIGVLGPLRVHGPRGEVELHGLRERLLLAHLVVAAGRIVSVATLIDGLWGENPPRTAGKSLQNVVLRVRKALGPDRSLLVTEPTGYRLDADAVDVDSVRFEALERAGALAEALALWRGAAYAGLDVAPVVAAEARRLEELRAGALEARVAADLANGAGPAAVAELEALVGRYPTRERLWTLLMTALYQHGRQSDALAAYDRARVTLAADLGLDPGPDLRNLQARILAQDPALDARPVGRVLPAELATAGGPLMGRERELAQLREAWAGAVAGRQVAVVVRGPVGAGAHLLTATFAREIAAEAGQVTYDGPRGVSTGSGARRGGPALVVRARGAAGAEMPEGSSLCVHLTGPDGAVPHGARVVDLSPLSKEEVRLLVAGVAPGAVLDEVVEYAFAASGGWPGGAIAAAVSFVRERATAAVASASTTADAAAATLVDARARVTGGLLDLRAAAAARLPPDRCPWPGLTAYTQDDGPWFAGRERFVAELAARIAGASCLAVVGPSGSGKSSLVHAGLLAGLADGLLPGSAGWDLLTLRPGPHPIAELARVVLGARRPDVGEILERLVRSGDDAAGRTVLVVDQLEEVWTACDDDGEQQAFLDALAGLVADGGSPVVLVLVVRADFLDRLADQPVLAVAAGDNTVLVPTPTSDDVRRAVLTPVRRAGLELEDGLLDAIVTDAGAEPGLLPLLSTSLRRLWERRDVNRLTLAAYVATDGLRGAIAHLAESEHARLDADGQRDVRSLLLRLAGPGEGDAVTRRRVHRAELASLPRDPTAVVERLAAARLLTVSDHHVEVAHEALFREWPRLRAWLEEDRAGREVERRLAVATAEWRSEDRDPALLWRGARLEAGLDVVASHPDEVTADERAFLDAGRAAADGAQRATARQNRRLRILLAAAVTLVLVAAGAGGLALRSRDREAAAAAAAKDAAVTADARRLAASALTVEQPDLALLTAVEATRLEQSPDTYGAVLTLLARQPDVVTRVRATDRFVSAVASPDGATVFLGESSPVLHAVDADTGKERWVRDDLPGQVYWLAVSPDGRTLAAMLIPITAEDGQDSVMLLDPETGREISRLGPADVNAVTGGDDSFLWGNVGWTGDGRLLVATDSAVVVVDAKGGLVASVPWGRRVVDTGTFLVWPDGRFSTGPSPGLGPAVVSQVGKRRPGGVRQLEETVLAVDPRGRRLAATRSGDAGTELVLLDADSLRPVSTAWPVEGLVTLARFSSDGARLLVAAGERVEVRDGRTAAPMTTLVGHSGVVNSAAYAGRRHDLAWAAGLDGTAVGYDLTGRRGVIKTWTTADTPWAGEGAAEADTVVWTDLNNADVNAAYLLRDGDRRGHRLPLTGLEGCLCEATSSDITADGTLALAGLKVYTEGFAAEVPGRGYVVAWDTATRQVRGLIRTPWPVYAVDSTPSGDRAVVLGAGGWGVVDLADLSLTTTYELARWTRSGYGTSLVEVAPDASTAALLVGPDVVLVDPDDGTVLRRQTVEQDPAGFAQSAAWTPDGNDLAVGTTGGWISVLDGHSLATRVPRRRVTPSVLSDVEVSPDGRTAATIGPQGDVTLWDVGTWRAYGQPLFDDGTVGFIQFTPDSTRLRARTSMGEISEVDVRPAAWVAAACEAAPRELTPEEWAVVRPGQPRRPTCDHAETSR
jgi:DNA-binding SARP family transcriptional activator/WD40 repeat protein